MLEKTLGSAGTKEEQLEATRMKKFYYEYFIERIGKKSPKRGTVKVDVNFYCIKDADIGSVEEDTDGGNPKEGDDNEIEIA